MTDIKERSGKGIKMMNSCIMRKLEKRSDKWVDKKCKLSQVFSSKCCETRINKTIGHLNFSHFFCCAVSAMNSFQILWL